MEKMKITIPKETFQIVKFQQDKHIGVASINVGVKGFSYKKVFRWHLSIVFDAKETNEASLLTEAEGEIFNFIEDKFDAIAIGPNLSRPNAIFVARTSWNKTVEFVWRVHDPERVHQILAKILEDKAYLRPFGYRIEDDPAWEKLDWYFRL